MTSNRQSLKKSRNLLKDEYKEAIQTISKILFQVDPLDVSDEDHPDEYDMEASSILAKIKGAKSRKEIVHVVKEELTHWFSEEDVNRMDPKEIEFIAKEIFEALSQTRLGEQDTPLNSGLRPS